VKLGILLLTYDRLDYARKTLEALRANLTWTQDLHVHIGDDGSSPEYRQNLLGLAEELWPEHGRTMTNSARSGYGANFNQATQVLHQTCDVVLVMEDDWELMRPLDLDRYSRALGEEVQAIRLGYLGMTQPLRGTIRYIEQVPLLVLDPDSEERHVNAGHPRIEMVSYQRRVGPWTEGLDPGATEFDWCGRAQARMRVAWPLDIRAPGDLFGHFGTLQAREDQR
jgi:hypothetical protein